jgi:predicted amidohydrolase
MTMSESEPVGVAALAIASRPWDLKHNARLIEDGVARAAGKGARIVCTPELALQGYRLPGETELAAFQTAAEPTTGLYLERFRALSNDLHIYLALGFAERSGPCIYNSLALLRPDGQMPGVYRKVHLGQEESLYFSAGDELCVFDTEYGPIGCMTCFDRQFPEMARVLALRGARLILNASAGGYGEWNDALLRTRAYENKSFLLFAHPQDGLVIDPFGDLIGRKGQDEMVLVRDIDLHLVDVLRSAECARFQDVPELYGRWRNPFVSRRPDLYGELSHVRS